MASFAVDAVACTRIVQVRAACHNCANRASSDSIIARAASTYQAKAMACPPSRRIDMGITDQSRFSSSEYASRVHGKRSLPRLAGADKPALCSASEGAVDLLAHTRRLTYCSRWRMIVAQAGSA